MKCAAALTLRHVRSLLLLTPLMMPALQAREGCTNRDFNGSFGFYATGHVIQSPVTTLAGPFARVGRLDADGDGRIRFASTASFNGILIPQDFGGKYTMNNLEFSGGVRYTMLGDARAEVGTPDLEQATFADNDAVSVGLGVAYRF